MRLTFIRMSQTRCFLRCRAQRHAPIELLTNGTEPNYLGRSPDTQIKDAFCSRHQISLDVLTSRHTIAIKQIGTNAAGLNGFALQPNQTYYAKHGDIIEVLHGKYFYEVCFDPAPATDAKEAKKKTRLKRQRSETADTVKTAVVAKRSCSTTSNDEDDDDPAKAVTSSLASTPTPPQPQALDRWDSEDAGRLLIFTSRGVIGSDRIAAYDLDGTIIRTKSGNVFPKGYDDWQIAFAEVPGKLKELVRSGYKIVFFTNQAGISTGKTDAKQWRQKLERIVQRLGVPVQAYAATGPSLYRKPKTGMWDTLKRLRNDGVRIDRQRSFFIGDAAGRPAVGKRRKDHSLADRLFALNVAVPFQTPEEHFQGAAKERYDPPKFIPAEALQQTNGGSVFEPADALQSLDQKVQQVILMVGAPGSGKSHIARNLLEQRYGLTVINQDTLGTWQKCVAALESALQQRNSAVVDNTNVDAETRLRYVQVAKRMGVKCRTFVMSTTEAHCKHNIAFRELTDADHSKIPDRLLVGMRNKYKEPQISEGFADIVKVHCVPQFKKKTDEQLYRMYLVEK